METIDRRVTGRRQPYLAMFAGVLAISAYAGAVGLMLGALDMGSEVEARFPFQAPVLAGLALALLVAVPMTVVARWAATGATHAAEAAIVAGALLVGWIVAQVVIIQTFSWLQPVMAGAGATVALGGLWLRRRTGPDS